MSILCLPTCEGWYVRTANYFFEKQSRLKMEFDYARLATDTFYSKCKCAVPRQARTYPHAHARLLPPNWISETLHHAYMCANLASYFLVLCRRTSGESNELIAPDCKVRVDREHLDGWIVYHCVFCVFCFYRYTSTVQCVRKQTRLKCTVTTDARGREGQKTCR